MLTRLRVEHVACGPPRRAPRRSSARARRAARCSRRRSSRRCADAARGRSPARADSRTRSASITTTRLPLASTLSAQRRERDRDGVDAIGVGRLRRRVDRAGRPRRRTLISPSSWMSRETVVCTTSWPWRRRAPAASSVCVEIGRSSTSRRIAACRSLRDSSRRHLRQDLEGTRRPPPRSTTSGGARRRTFGPDVRQTSPASSAASTTGCAGPSSSAPTSRPAPRTSATPGSVREPGRRAARRSRERCCEQLVVDRVADRAGGGADDRVAAEGRAVVAGRERAGGVVGDEQAADRQAVREPLRERDELRTHAELLEREERCRCGRRRSAPRRRRAARRARRRARRPRRGSSCSSGITPPSPSTGSSRISPTSSRRGRAQRDDVVRAGEARARAAAARSAARFAGWPVTASAPVVRPWKLCSSAITPGLPVALRAYFSAASFASAPELQKNACAPPNRSDRRRASACAGSVREQVRRVPELVELRVRGGERRRMTVTEADDGDARRRSRGSAGPASSEQPDAVAVDERDARRGIRRQQRALEHARSRDHRRRRRSRRRARCAPRATRRAASARCRRRSGRSRRASRRVPPGSSGASQPSWKTPGTSVRKTDLVGADADGERRGGLVGVDVQRPLGERRHAPGRARPRAPAGPPAARSAAAARRARAPGTCVAFSPISSPASETASGPIARAQLLVDGGEAVAHDLERLRRGHAPPADELHLEPAPRHLLRDLRAGAVHDADRVAGGAQARDRLGRSPRRRAANLEDDEAHER